MNALKKKPIALKGNIDTIFWESLNKLEGENGIDILPNDKPDIISRLIKTLKDRDGLPDDLNNPKTMDEAEAVNEFATTLYELFSKGMEKSEAMMVGKEVERAYENIMDESGEAMSDYDKMVDAGHSAGDF